MDAHSTLRRINRADLEALVALERAAFADPWSREQLRAALRWDGSLAFGIEEPGTGLVAYLLGLVVVDQGEILSLATLPSHRRRGLGWKLVTATLEAMAGRGVTSVWLEVRASNQPAQALYREAGFVASGVRKGYYRHPVEDALVLRRDLDSGASAGTRVR